MTSEQNVPEVESHQGSTISPGQQDGEAQFTPTKRAARHGSVQEQPPPAPQAQEQRLRRRPGRTAKWRPGNRPACCLHPGLGRPTAIAELPVRRCPAAERSSGGGKRWKKKFRDRDRQRSPENPGNVASGSNGGGGGYRDRDTHQPGNNSGGFKRKGGGGKQQRGPRSFVGPMDHSYRAVNGNFAETPPSTMDSGNGNYGRSNGHGGGRSYQSDSQPIDYSQGRSIPIPENAPTKIFFFIEDLFFIAKIQETARKLGVKVAFVKNEKDAIAALTAGAEEDLPGLIVFDLNNANAKPLTLIPKLKAKLKRSTSIVGFLSHLQGDLKAKAVEAGCDTVMPRAAFSQNLPNLLRRYGMEEEEEPNYNQ